MSRRGTRSGRLSRRGTMGALPGLGVAGRHGFGVAGRHAFGAVRSPTRADFRVRLEANGSGRWVSHLSGARVIHGPALLLRGTVPA
jgi:hypothetical protein